MCMAEQCSQCFIAEKNSDLKFWFFTICLDETGMREGIILTCNAKKCSEKFFKIF